MTDTYLEQIWIDKVDELDMIALTKAVEASYYGHKVEHILASVETFESQLWRGESPGGRFVVVTQLFQHPGGKQLLIWSIGGEGYLEAMDTVFEVLKDYARKVEAKWLSANVRKGFTKFADRFGVEAEYTNWITEIKDVPDQTKH